MNNGLREVITAAVQIAGRSVGADGTSKPVPLLRAAEATPSPVPQATALRDLSAEAGGAHGLRHRRRAPTLVADGDPTNGDTVGAEGGTARGADLRSEAKGHAGSPDTLSSTPSMVGESSRASAQPTMAEMFPSADGGTGPGTLRLAFWLCGFHGALMERRQHGEKLTPSEELLVQMSSKDFANMRPMMIEMILDRLKAVLHDPQWTGQGGPMERFAVATLGNLADRAGELFRDAGPDAALSLFGTAEAANEPLAIFQQVFTTALDLVEAFERIIPGKSKLLDRLAEALDSEVEKI